MFPLNGIMRWFLWPKRTVCSEEDGGKSELDNASQVVPHVSGEDGVISSTVCSERLRAVERWEAVV